MSLDPPQYLFSLQNNIRTRPIPWDGAVRAGTISEDQLSKIRAVDKVRKEQRKQIVEGDLEGYRALFVGADGKQSVLESAAKRADVVQYILVLLGDLIDGGLLSLLNKSPADNIIRYSCSLENSCGIFESIQRFSTPPHAIE
jgi:V-type H+-transporting ATPase subunit H